MPAPAPAPAHVFTQAYVASKSPFSSKSVCDFHSLVARMKWSGITGNLFSTRLYAGFCAGICAIRSSAEGFSKGSGFLVVVVVAGGGWPSLASGLGVAVGFLARAGQ